MYMHDRTPPKGYSPRTAAQTATAIESMNRTASVSSRRFLMDMTTYIPNAARPNTAVDSGMWYFNISHVLFDANSMRERTSPYSPW